MKPLIVRSLLAAAVGLALAAPACADGTPKAVEQEFTWVESGAAAAAPPANAAEAEAARAELRAAREELRALTRRIAELSVRAGASEAPRAMAFRYLSNPDRAMIGVVLGAWREKSGGVVLAAVTPGGPADKAGLRAGDRVMAINGKPVGGGDGAVRAAQDLIGELKAGDAVRLAIERDGKRQELTATAERRESWDWPSFAEGFAPLPPDFERNVQVIVERGMAEAENARELAEEARALAQEHAGEARAHHRSAAEAQVLAREAQMNALGELRRIVISKGGGFFDLRLADVNPALGKYFGASDGVLVLDKDPASLAPLQPGDVILSIGGERTESSRDVMRALAARAEQPAVNVEVMRDRKRQVLVVDVPAGSDFDVMFPAPPAPPSPPARAPKAAPPAPPSPPAPPARPAPPAPAATAALI
jgi:membrane-associated protease RseP (regulator of RpoE activity)